MPGPIALLTDFGASDHYVGSMKAAILGVNPRVQIIDISHEIAAQDTRAAAYVLRCAYLDYPSGTIFVAVVDPGVGTERRALAIQANGFFFLGPDNGVFSYILKDVASAQVLQINNPKFFRNSVSQTFHGRDIFAPVAAHLSNGVEFEKLGIALSESPQQLNALYAERSSPTHIKGEITRVDAFGNLLTNIPREMVQDTGLEVKAVKIASLLVPLVKTYAASGEFEFFALWGSSGFLEVCTQNGAASIKLKIGRGAACEIHCSRESSLKLVE